MKVSGQITENFSLNEMACNDADGTLVLSADAVRHAQRLQEFRVWYARSMPVNSWYRTVAYNTKVKGSPKSQHLLGMATDIALPAEYFKFTPDRKKLFISNCKKKWFELTGKDGLGGGFGEYSTFMHLDSRKERSEWKL